MPMMGRGSDTRMYAPRSESDRMYSSANEDEGKYSPSSPEDLEARREKKRQQEQERKEKREKIKHVKVSSKLPLDGNESPMGEDDGNKQDLERELGMQGGPAGSRGHMLDMATGAKSGTGSSMGGTPLYLGEAMDDAWSTLLKRETRSSIEARRRREKRREFRPSTGQFKRPPGGMNPAGATMRRFRARMRGIKGGKKTGLMKPHLSVEMSHRGIATKQPMSKDPQKYRAYMGQSEARKILGNVRTTFSPHARYSERSSYAGPTGAGRLGGLLAGQAGQMRQPALRPMRVRRPRMPRMPRMPRPPMPPMMPSPQSSMVPSMPAPPSSIMMSDERAESELLKGPHARRVHMLNLIRRLIAAQEKAAKLQKSMTGTRSAMENGHVPAHPAGVRAKDEEDPEGPTENNETDAKRFGVDPAGYIVSQRGHMG